MNAFIKLGVIEPLAQVLYQQGIRIPTVIQQASIPAIFKGKDIIGRSETGTGKTLAYLLPLVQRVDVKKGGTQVLIMTPTRELAKQIFDVLRPFAILMEADVADIIGGRTIENQIQKLKREPHIIIGTPGRLLDHIRRRSLDLSGVKTVVLDEADQMLAAGFREDIDALVDETSKKRQVLLFSATMPPEAKKLAHKYMKSAVVADVAEKAVASTVDEIHGNMSQGQRNQVIREFEKARTQVLVASDIAARGLDVEGITHVFNYDIPRNLEYYIHRIGRTGRAGTQGVSITYATPEDILLLRKLEKAIKEIITKYDEKGNIRRIKGPSAKKKVILPGMYKPTKKKEHKVLGHKGGDMRKKKKKREAKGSRRGK